MSVKDKTGIGRQEIKRENIIGRLAQKRENNGWSEKLCMEVILLSMEPWAAANNALRLCGGATSSCPGS